MRAIDLTDMTFHKSSHSKAEECVEVARASELVAVRDSKDPDGPALLVPSAVFDGFLRRLR